MLKTRSALAGAVTVAALGLAAQAAASGDAPPECGVGQLAARLKPGSPGMGQRYATLTLTNRSRITCRTGGYIGLGLETASGRALETHLTRDPGRVRTLVLRPGAQATTLLHWGAIPDESETPGDTCYRAPAKVLITPPNSYSAFTLTWRQGVVCEHGTLDTTPLAAAH